MKNLFTRKKPKAIIAAYFAIALFLTSTLNVSAETYSFAGRATHTSSWSNYSDVTKTKYNLTKSKKTVTRTVKDKGATWFTPVYATTDNYKHKKGNNDIKIKNVKQWTHTIKGTVSGEVKGFGAELGYEGSYKTSKEIEHSIDKNASSGYYYYGVKCKMIDLRVMKDIEIYKKNKNGKYKYTEGWFQYDSGCRIFVTGQSPLYYSWHKS